LFSCESATGRATLELFNHETFDHHGDASVIRNPNSQP
jgi:hypothetical protein